MRRNIEGKYQESREYNRTKEDEVEELLNKNAKQNQRIYEVSQKCSNLQLKLQEEVAMRSHLLEEQEKRIEEKYREIKNSIQKESHTRA
jgi:vacuolar-type H+-ATPase subunit I/STV1